MLNRNTLKQLRTEIGIDNLIETLYSTAEKIKTTRTDLAELNKRVRDKEITLSDMELPMLKAVAENGKNETERKAILNQLRTEDAEYQRINNECLDAKHHRDMVDADLENYISRFSAQRHACDLITATLNASCE